MNLDNLKDEELIELLNTLEGLNDSLDGDNNE